MKVVIGFYTLLTGVSIVTATALAQPAATVAQRLDSIAGAGVRENRSVGLVAAVVRRQERLLLEAYGKADVEGDVPMSVDTIVPIASVTKQFTAAAILQLRDEGKLSLDDEIAKWLPDLETRGSKVTLRHLLGHTAGIAELGGMQELREMQLMRNPTVTRDTVYDVIRRYPLQFAPGTMQVYSNTGFWLLGRIVEKASGMTYEDYVEKRIFARLGMSRSMYCSNAKNAPRRAYGYGMKSGVPRRAAEIVNTGNYAAGALCSTAEDLITWLQALHGGKVLTPRSYAEMITPVRLNDGTSTRYSLGLLVWNDSRGLPKIGHDGGGFGYSSHAWWHPDAQLAIVLLTNSEPDDTTAVAEALTAELLPPGRPVGPFTGEASRLAGTYTGPGRGKEMIIAVTQTPQGIAFSVDGAAANPLQWVEALTFRRNAALLTFRASTNGGPASELRFDTGGDHFVLKRQ